MSFSSDEVCHTTTYLTLHGLWPLINLMFYLFTDKSPFTVGNWVSQGPTSHTNDILVDDSRIFINTSGLYFVYSQIFFSDLYKGQALSNKSHTFYHYVYRFNHIYPNDGQELLLKSVRTECWAKSKFFGDYTSYTAGVFRLNVGDQIFVKVSQIRLMSRDRQASFFGVALMYP